MAAALSHEMSHTNLITILNMKTIHQRIRGTELSYIVLSISGN